MVRIAARVWKEWRDLSEDDEPAIQLVFTSAVAPAHALAAVRRAAAETVRALESRPPLPTGDPFRTGSFTLALAPAGVALRIDEEPDDFGALVRGIAERLEAGGIEGELDVYEPRAVVPIPDVVDFLEARLRVRGERRPGPFGGPKRSWYPEPEALAAGVDAAVGWCAGNDPGAPLSFSVYTMPPTALHSTDDAREYVRTAIEGGAHGGFVRVASTAPERLRVLALNPSDGRITLLEGGPTMQSAGWQSSLANVRAALAAAARWVVYGFVKRGSYRPAAELGGSLYQDWPRIPHFFAPAGTERAW
ncbi:MAG: hypothetical protein M3321_08150 [Actinomycetota bacterium]|nr:hypothetical protein [Actinomycetota bacterium]